MSFDFRGADALLMIGDSERNADLFYATHFRAPDPFVFVWTLREKVVMVSDLELDRARSQAQVDRVAASSRYEGQLRSQGQEQPGFNDLLLAFLQDLGVWHLLVPAEFSLGTAEFLRAANLQLQVAPSPLFPQRQFKTKEEIEAIRSALAAAEQSMEVAIQTLRQAEIRDGVLYHQGQVLTAERLRRLIHLSLMEQDCTASHTIVAGGEQGCNPHQEGWGPLHAGESIIIDIFPQSTVSGYFGDITRTVVKGRVPEAIRKLYEIVRRGQELALEQIRAGVDGRQIHRTVQQFFAEAGYQTKEQDGHMQGFFHGTGHGLGLEIHELPRLGSRSELLKAGQVVTVEPGLYYPGLGGVRLEDVVVVREGGCENLTTYPKELEV